MRTPMPRSRPALRRKRSSMHWAWPSWSMQAPHSSIRRARSTPTNPRFRDAMILLQGRAHDLGDGFTVRRMLPSVERRTVGPFVFFDYFGPARFAPGKGIDVRPHPHIGLATVTYLFEGSQVHRDNIGSVQTIAPGDVNWMVAGSGIVHSERTGPDVRATGHTIHGIQTWVGLPQADEETAPRFEHYAMAELPVRDEGGVHLRVVAGHAFGLASPVKVFSG